MKKMMLVVLMVMALTGLLSGCNDGSGKETPATTDKMEASGEVIPTLDEVISGTWKAYATFDEAGKLTYDISVEISYTFNSDGSFSVEYIDDGVNANASFQGTYEIDNDESAGNKNPYDWYYGCTISKTEVENAGGSSFMRFISNDYTGTESLFNFFKFRDLDGEKMLWEDGMRIYFKKQ